MATVGQPLTAPETGWKRYDDNNVNFSYFGGWVNKVGFDAIVSGADFADATDGNAYGGGTKNGNGTGSDIKFNFVGSKLRIIGCNEGSNYGANQVDVFIDEVKVGDFTQKTPERISQCLNFSIDGLVSKEHSVTICTTAYEGFNEFIFDAVDIDENGELKPYSSIVANSNLNAAAGDAQVALSWTAVSGATGYNVKRSTTAGGPYTTIASNTPGTSYIDTSVTNGTTYYYVVTAITANGESGNSNEASATPQAAVTPPSTGNQLLRVTVIDSSDHDYQLSSAEIDGFVNWFLKHANADTAGYMLAKKVGTQTSKEYLAFDKIISFEVI
ncbi:MAG: hypothetical protein LLG02_14060 [Pelosinus sp.]|nr:hypothetical protein [Pelosinus sp.]